MEIHPARPKTFFEKFQKLIFIAGFSVLAGMFGLGLTWLAYATTVLMWFKKSNHSFDPISWCVPVIVTGGIVGFIIGLVFSLKMAASGPAAIAEFDRKHVRGRGRGRIYAGFPVLIMVLLMPLGGRISRLVGQKYDVYVFLGIILVITAIGLILQGLLPKRWTMLMGIVGWLLTLVFAIWYCFFGLGAFGHATFGVVLF